jgi:hypothetical protein
MGEARSNGDAQAFPAIDSYSSCGLSKREYFAAQVLSGLSANQEWMKNAVKASGLSCEACVAQGAREMADALLAELAAQP